MTLEEWMAYSALKKKEGLCHSREELTQRMTAFYGFTPCIPPHAYVKGNETNMSFNNGPYSELRYKYYGSDDTLLCSLFCTTLALINRDDSITPFPGLPNTFSMKIYGEGERILHDITLRRCYENDAVPTVHYACYKTFYDENGKHRETVNEDFDWVLPS